MNVGWVIDASVFFDYCDELAAAVVRQGQTVRLVNRPRPPYGWDDTDQAYRRSFSEGSCVVTHADIDLVHRVLADRIWTPGGFATAGGCDCSRYFPHLGRFLLNQDYMMLPFGEIRRCADFLFNVFGLDGRIFIRPDSALKLFTGQIVSHGELDRDLEHMAFYEFPTESLVVVSSPKEIDREWRFVVAREIVVAGSQYKRDGAMSIASDIPLEARQKAEEVAAAGYAPDPVWILDVCRTTDGRHHLLEIGSFSFANLYACDKDAVARAVSNVAWEIHQRARQVR